MAGSTLATGYVQIIPSARGIGAGIQKAIGGDAEKAGQSAGISISSGIKRVLAAAAIGTAITAGVKKAVEEGGKLQQSYGGLETIYGKAAEKAKEYAAEAVNAGISANDYAEQAVSFGASLKQAFEGDTKKAVEAANTAILDMTDNAAKMGTPIQSIQDAYQGFAKQNYTMLDNLKLGYGGTKTEMERLLADATKLSGVKYDISNLGDVYEAIHVIQEDLGLTGVAADEAATTFEGSFNAMKAAAANLLGNLALGENVKQSMNDLARNASNFLFDNLIPMVGTVFKSLPEAAGAFMEEGFPKIKESGAKLVQSITGNMTPGLISAGSEMITKLGEGLVTGIPTFLSNVLPMIVEFSGKLREYSGNIIDVGLQFVTNLAQGIINSIPVLVSTIPTIITNLAGIINDNAPKLVVTGVTIAINLVKGIISAMPMIIANIPKILEAIVSVWMAFNWMQLGKNAIALIKNGFTAAKTALPEALKSGAETAKEWFLAIDWTTLGKDVLDLVVIGVKAAGKMVPVALKAIGTTAVNIFKSVSWLAVGKAALTLIGKGISGAAGLIRSAVQKPVDFVKDKIKTGFESARKTAVNSFKSMAKGIKDKIEEARDKVKGAVEKIKGFFPLKIGKIFSGLKLPHFNVSGGSAPYGVGGKGSLPHFSVSWYKKAVKHPYLFTDATLFGAGETDDEMLYSKNALMDDIRNAVGGERVVNITNYITVDGTEDPEEFAERFVRRLELEMRTA